MRCNLVGKERVLCGILSKIVGTIQVRSEEIWTFGSVTMSSLGCMSSWRLKKCAQFFNNKVVKLHNKRISITFTRIQICFCTYPHFASSFHYISWLCENEYRWKMLMYAFFLFSFLFALGTFYLFSHLLSLTRVEWFYFKFIIVLIHFEKYLSNDKILIKRLLSITEKTFNPLFPSWFNLCNLPFVKVDCSHNECSHHIFVLVLMLIICSYTVHIGLVVLRIGWGQGIDESVSLFSHSYISWILSNCKQVPWENRWKMRSLQTLVTKNF